MSTVQTREKGFTLSVILIVSLTAITIGLALLQNISSTQADNIDRRNTRLAQQAAEAGLAYALSCLEASYHQLTWGSANANKPLTQSTDCNGNISASLPSYVLPSSPESRVQTKFTVGEPETLSAASVQLKAVGVVEVLVGSTTTVGTTFTSTLKKTTVWNPNLIPQRSSSGSQRTCGLLSNSVWCWGTNVNGELGDGTYTDSVIPVPVKRLAYGANGIGNHAVVDMASGGNFNCLAIDTGEVYCWGINIKGNLGQGSYSPADSNVPIRVPGLPANDKVVSLALGNTHACALTNGGNLYCWGAGTNGQIGNNTITDQLSPVYVGGVNAGGFGGLNNNKVIGLSKSGGFQTHTCAIAVDNKAYCWGSNMNGQGGNGTLTASIRIPTAVVTTGALNGKKVTAIATDGPPSSTNPAFAHTCVVAYTTTPSDARAYCWGDNSYGAIGNNGNTCNSPTVYNTNCFYNTPVAVNTTGVLNGKIIKEIATSQWSSCATAYASATPTNTQAYCWGHNRTLGNGSTTGISTVPVAVSAAIFSGNPVDQLIGGTGRMCSRSNNKIYCWGNNNYGQIGDGTTIDPRPTPTEALFLRTRDSQYLF